MDGRYGRPDEIAGAVAHLALPEAAFVDPDRDESVFADQIPTNVVGVVATTALR